MEEKQASWWKSLWFQEKRKRRQKPLIQLVGSTLRRSWRSRSNQGCCCQLLKLLHAAARKNKTSGKETPSTQSLTPSNKGSKKSHSFVRALSWSHYVEASGGMEAVEVAHECTIDLSELFLGQKFASGAYSRLYHGIYKQQEVAVKLIIPPEEDSSLSSRLDRQFSHEVSLLSRLQHSNIVRFVAACKKPPVFCVVTEYLPGGSLKTFLHKNEPHSLNMHMVVRIALDVARGMEYLHSQGVIHRDLKSDNLIMTDDLHIKVADFGVSCLESHKEGMNGYAGTYRWMAPEMMEKKPCSRKVDVYSFAIVLWELLTGLTPFQELTAVQAAFAVCQKKARPVIPSDCPKIIMRLLQRCWSANPVKRPEFSQIVKTLEKFQQSLREVSTGSGVGNSFPSTSEDCFRGSLGVPHGGLMSEQTVKA